MGLLGRTEEAIARKLHVSLSTIGRDRAALQENNRESVRDIHVPDALQDQVVIALDVKDLGVRKMIAPTLYWGLALVWDGKAYNLKPSGLFSLLCVSAVNPRLEPQSLQSPD